MVRDCIAFKADFPDDAQYDNHGILIVPRGKAVMISLAGTLARKGCAISQVRQCGTVGWGMEMTREGVDCVCLLQNRLPVMVMVVTPRLSLLGKLFGGKRASRVHEEVVEAIAKVICADTRFSEVRLMTREEFGS